MKKLVPLFALTCITIMSCHHDRDISITYNDADDYYSMNAYFSKNKMRDVEHYMDRMIGRRSNMTFVNARIDGTLGLEDHTTFYIKKYPGHIKIKLDKNENSYQGYEKIRAMCEGVKEVLTGEEQ